MSRTGPEVEKDVFDIIAASSLKNKVNGVVCMEDERPKDSELEDIVVKFVSGIPGVIETGSVAVLIYVKDIDLYGDGTFRQNKPRLKTLSQEAASWVKDISKRSIETGYKFRLLFSINTQEAPDIHQHYLSIRLHYKAVEKD